MKGSIQKRVGKNGVTWTVVVDLPRDPVTGKRRQKRISAKTKKEAERLAAQAIHAIDNGNFADSGKQTVADYLEHWLDTYARGACKPTTYDRYASLIRTHIIPAIGHLKLDKLTPMHLTQLYRQKLDGGRLDGKPGGLSARTVRYIHATLHEALHHAMRWGLVVRNVADVVDPPALARKDMQTWDVTQSDAFLSAAEGSRYYPVFALAILTGLRRGELLALRWQDVDLERGELTVRQTLIDRNGRLEFSTPKTHRSRRSVALPDSAVALLRQHKARQNQERLTAGEAWAALDLVFATELGKPLHPRNLFRAFRQITKQAGVPVIRFHDLRHSHATLLFAAGTHPKVVSERLGHATISITLDTYSHVLPGMQKDAVTQLDALFNQAKARRA